MISQIGNRDFVIWLHYKPFISLNIGRRMVGCDGTGSLSASFQLVLILPDLESGGPIFLYHGSVCESIFFISNRGGLWKVAAILELF